jgi:hypothetical protein
MEEVIWAYGGVIHLNRVGLHVWVVFKHHSWITTCLGEDGGSLRDADRDSQHLLRLEQGMDLLPVPVLGQVRLQVLELHDHAAHGLL